MGDARDLREFAFPQGFQQTANGMTLRDYFAAHAVQGTLDSVLIGIGTPEERAKFAYAVADAMLKVRVEE